MILNPSRKYTTFGKPNSFEKHLLKLPEHTEIQYSRRKGIEYTLVNQNLKIRSRKSNHIPHTLDDPKAF